MTPKTKIAIYHVNPHILLELKLVKYNSTKCLDSVKRPMTDVTDVTRRDITYVESLQRRKKNVRDPVIAFG